MPFPYCPETGLRPARQSAPVAPAKTQAQPDVLSEDDSVLTQIEQRLRGGSMTQRITGDREGSSSVKKSGLPQGERRWFGSSGLHRVTGDREDLAAVDAPRPRL